LCLECPNFAKPQTVVRKPLGTMKSKLLKYGLWTIGTILTVGLTGYIILLNTFDIFNTPDKKILSYKCDYEGLREAETYRLEGNAVTNPSIHVSVHLDCNGDKRKDEKLIFTADNSSVDDKDVTITWLTFDTLTIEYTIVCNDLSGNDAEII
jgi:hypothetical protein